MPETTRAKLVHSFLWPTKRGTVFPWSLLAQLPSCSHQQEHHFRLVALSGRSIFLWIGLAPVTNSKTDSRNIASPHNIVWKKMHFNCHTSKHAAGKMADSNRQLQNVWMFSGQTIFFCYFDALHVVSVISHQLTFWVGYWGWKLNPCWHWERIVLSWCEQRLC